MKVAVFGLGYVGTVTAACLATNGHDVWGVDPDSTKVEMISQGRSPVVEPGVANLVAEGVASGSLHATTEPLDAIDRADLSLVCVGTPSSPGGSTDLSYLLRAVKEIGQALVACGLSPSAWHSVVVRSTVPPGCVEGIVVPALEAEMCLPIGRGFGVAMCPEFLREGSGVADFFDPPSLSWACPIPGSRTPWSACSDFWTARCGLFQCAPPRGSNMRAMPFTP